jgi:hypothetical protein
MLTLDLGGRTPRWRSCDELVVIAYCFWRRRRGIHAMWWEDDYFVSTVCVLRSSETDDGVMWMYCRIMLGVVYVVGTSGVAVMQPMWVWAGIPSDMIGFSSFFWMHKPSFWD